MSAGLREPLGLDGAASPYLRGARAEGVPRRRDEARFAAHERATALLIHAAAENE